MPAQPSGTITFLFTDIEGSTRLWEQHEEAMRDVLAKHDAVLRRRIADHDGYVFTTAGDAFSAAFADPSDAVEAALEAQREFASEQWAVGPVRVRMALHTGVAHERDGDYFGPTLNRSARILSSGHGGQILLSQTVCDLVSSVLPAQAELRDLGLHRLKDLGAPERLRQLTHPDLVSDFPELRTLDTHLNNLPHQPSSFVGRREELAEIVERVGGSRLVTLTGVGGSGKTRLALQTAAEVTDRFADGVWLVELARLTEPERLPQSIVDQLELALGQEGLVGAEGRTELQIVRSHFARKAALLVLDNCEHLIGAAAEVVDELLRTCPDLQILTTSREGLGVRGEYLIQVPSMRLPQVGVDQDESAYTDAVELFAERAAAANSKFILDDHTLPAVAEICRRLDGMPLALELAAARTRMLTVEQVAERLSDAFRLLTGGSRTALPRQQTLLAAIDWSYQLLTEAEQSLFARLAVFRSGFALEAVEAVVSGDGVDGFEVFDLLASLVDKSMVTGGADTGRFGMLETLRQFSLGKLRESGESDRWRQRHAEYFATLADDAYDGTRGADQIAWFRTIQADRDNFDAALTWAVEDGHVRTAARIANGLWWFWAHHGQAEPGTWAMDRIVVDLETLEPELQVRVLAGRTLLDATVNATDRRIGDARRALEIAETIESSRLKGLSSYAIAIAHQQASSYQAALEHHQAAYEAFRDAGDEWGMGWTSLNPAYIHRMRAAADAARPWLEQAEHHYRAAGSRVGLGWTLIVLGVVRRYGGDFEGSIAAHRQAAEIFAELGIERLRAFNLILEVISLDHADRTGEALVPLGEAMQIHRSLGELPVESAAIGSMVHRHLGNLRAAHGFLTRTRGQLVDASPSELAVLAEEIADLGVQLGLFEGPAHLIGYAVAERGRVDRPIPAQFQPERDRTREAIRGNVDAEPIWESWADRSKDEATALMGEVLDGIGRALGLDRGSEADGENASVDRARVDHGFKGS